MRRLQDITASYHTPQGLKVLPWFVLALAVILVNPILDIPQGQLGYPCLIGVPGVVVAGWLSVRIGRHYDRAFGRVQRTRRDCNRELAEGIVIVVLVYVGFSVNSMGRVPVSVLLGLGRLYVVHVVGGQAAFGPTIL